MDPFRRPMQGGEPAARERSTLRLALISAAALVLLPLAWFLVEWVLGRLASAPAAAGRDIFDKKPPAEAAPPSAPQASGPAAQAPSAPPSPARPRTDGLEPGTVIKVVDVRNPRREQDDPRALRPKLKPMTGWAPTNVRSLQDPGMSKTLTEPVYYLTPNQAETPPAPKATVRPEPAQTAAPPAAHTFPDGAGDARSPTSTAPKPKPVLKPVPTRTETPASEWAPAPPVFQTTVEPPGPTRTMDHVPPSDLGPGLPAQQGSEPARSDGTCLRPGWWRNSWTQTCHQSLEACRRADQNGACTQ
ncbi:MAG: hypothetical protein HY748_05105 [Elusimicrobia bacterium]|nr:hypothetical protein [Elusimicrobiota bacterium]